MRYLIIEHESVATGPRADVAGSGRQGSMEKFIGLEGCTDSPDGAVVERYRRAADAFLVTRGRHMRSQKAGEDSRLPFGQTPYRRHRRSSSFGRLCNEVCRTSLSAVMDDQCDFSIPTSRFCSSLSRCDRLVSSQQQLWLCLCREYLWSGRCLKSFAHDRGHCCDHYRSGFRFHHDL